MRSPRSARCRFALCSERLLHDLLHELGSLCSNPCDAPKGHTVGLIILEPVQAMGISIQEQVIRDIIKLSPCHPNLILYRCQQAILEADAQYPRQIFPADLYNVRHSSTLQQSFLEATWGISSPLDQVILSDFSRFARARSPTLLFPQMHGWTV